MFCQWQFANLTWLKRYAADNFETTREQRQQLKNAKAFLEDSLEEEGNEENVK